MKRYRIRWSLSTASFDYCLSVAKSDEGWDGDMERLMVELYDSAVFIKSSYTEIISFFGNNVRCTGYSVIGDLLGTVEVSERELDYIISSCSSIDMNESESNVEYEFDLYSLEQLKDDKIDSILEKVHIYDELFISFQVNKDEDLITD